MLSIQQYIGWQYYKLFIPIYASCSGRHDVGQGNVNILQYLLSDRRYGDSNKRFLNLLIQFYFNNMINFHHLTLKSVTLNDIERRNGFYFSSFYRIL